MTPALTAPILVLVVYILIAASGGLDLLSLGSEESVYLSTIAVRLLVFIVPGIFYVKLKESGYTLRLGFSPIGIGKIGFCLTVLGALISFSLLIRMFTGHMEASLPVIMPGLEEAAASVGDANFFYILVSFAIVPAVCEEFIFRAILLTEYSEYGCPTAVITSAALYGMLAFSPADFPLLFVMGILLGISSMRLGALPRREGHEPAQSADKRDLSALLCLPDFSRLYDHTAGHLGKYLLYLRNTIAGNTVLL